MQSTDQSLDNLHRRRLTRNLRLILCLTFVGSGVAFLYNMIMGGWLPLWTENYQNGVLKVPGMLKVAFEDSLETPRFCFVLDGFLALGSLIGGVMMWRLRRTGLFFYSCSQVLTIVVSFLFMGRANTQMGNIMMTILFVAYYFGALKRIGTKEKMNNLTNNTKEPTV